MKKTYNGLPVMLNRLGAFVCFLRTKAVQRMTGCKKKNVAEHRFEKPTSYKWDCYLDDLGNIRLRRI